MDYEVIIIGGSYAGMAAAENLGQARRKVLVLDGNDPRNKEKMDEENYGTAHGVTPRQTLDASRAKVARMRSVEYRPDLATSLQKTDEGFILGTEKGDKFTCLKVLLASGIDDIMLDIPGFAECWTVSIMHCPYCYGFKEQNTRIALIGNGDGGYELAELLSRFTKQLHLFTNGPADFTEKHSQYLQENEVTLHFSPIKKVQQENGQVSALLLEDGSEHAFEQVFARTPFNFRTPFALEQGCSINNSGLIEVDAYGETSVPGIFAAGDICTNRQQIMYAQQSGLMAAIGLTQAVIRHGLQQL